MRETQQPTSGLYAPFPDCGPMPLRFQNSNTMEHRICKNCGFRFVGRYCNSCGQKHHEQADKGIRSIIAEAFHFMTHFEGTFFTTFRTILLRPGRMSVDYCYGRRKRYYKPISFFLLLILLYLLFPIAEGLNMRLEYYKGMDFFGDALAQMIQNKAAALGISETVLGEIFRAKSAKISKILLLLLLPLTAMVLYLLHFRSQRPAFDYLILATEINNFFVLFLFLLLPPMLVVIAGLLQLQIEESLFNAIMFVPLLLYIIKVQRTFFRDKWIWAILKSLLFFVGYYFCSQIIYKLLLFLLVFLLL